jgi:hypothetical protein
MSADAGKCQSCSSERREEFNAETAIHFRGLEGLNKPIVWVFPRVLVCLDCGLTELFVPARELSVLKHGIPVEGAIISTAQKTPIKNRFG